MARLIVSIPTTNRPLIVVPTIRDIARQTRLPDLVQIVIADESDIDVDALADLPFPIHITQSERGLTLQRNTTLSALNDDDLLLFLDDDFLMAPDYLTNLEQLFAQNPEVVMSTGKVLADGIHGPGLTHEQGESLALFAAGPTSAALEDVYNCYGCNMALRAGPMVANDLEFDLRLKFYGWLEDVDFSRQMAAFGRIVKSSNLHGVHLGTKTGRSKGLRLGYSQVANPIYLFKKGTMVFPRALNIMGRNVASNLFKSLRPEPEIDRMGRLKGNMKAFGDLFLGRLHPEQVMKFK